MASFMSCDTAMFTSVYAQAVQSSSSQPCLTVKEEVEEVLTPDITTTILAVSCAEKLPEWRFSHGDEAKAASAYLVSELKRCFHTSWSPRVARDKLWQNFFTLRSSESFWKRFLLKSIGATACPIFFQYITDKMMETLISTQFHVTAAEQECTTTQLDFNDISALRYTAGRPL